MLKLRSLEMGEMSDVLFDNNLSLLSGVERLSEANQIARRRRGRAW